MDINDAVDIDSRGYDNTLNNGQRVVVRAYIESVLEDEQHIGDYVWAVNATDLFEELLNMM